MIYISSVKFNNELRTAQDLTYLLACIGEKVAITVDFYYEDITYAATDNFVTLKPDAADIDVVDNTGIILSEDGQAFANTYAGDTIGVSIGGACLYYTVLEKFDNGMIRTSYAGAKVEMASGDFIFNSTAFNGLKYAYNLVENGNSYNSLIDSEYQQLISATIDCSVLTPINLAFTGLKSYQIGSATLTGMGGVGGTGGTLGTFEKQKFRIIHNTVITPFFLTSQYADLLLGVKPDYFQANSCLNYISQIQLGRNLTNPNGLQTLQLPNALSNTGWFNERFNGGINNYSLSSLVIKKGVTTINALEFDTDITVEATIDNATDSPFSSGNTKYVFGFNYLPEIDSLYQNNGENQTRNFLFDSKLNTLGSGSANGNNIGSGMRVIKSVTSTFISSSSMKVTATINIGADAKTILEQGDFSRYQMWLITENHANTAVNSDKVNLLLQVSEFEVELINTNIIQSDGINFIAHPYNDSVSAIDGLDLEVYPVDDIVANLDFSIDYSDAVTVPGNEAIGGFTQNNGTASTNWLIVDEINNKTIGVADFTVDFETTLDLLVTSINTNTAQGTIFGGFPSFDNSFGWVVTSNSYNGFDYIINIQSPAGSIYNGFTVVLKGDAGDSTSAAMTGGSDSVTPLGNQGAKIKSIRSKILLKDANNIESDIILEDFSFSTSAYPVVGGMAQNIAFSQDRAFKIPSEIRKTITCERDFASDVLDVLHFNYQYPFMQRWEYWEALVGLLTPPSEIFDNTKPLNGINQFWYRFTTVTDWHLWYDIIFTIEQNGLEFTQTFSAEVKDSHDYDSNAEWSNNTIKSYDITTLAEITSGGEKFIKGYKDVKIVASFEKVSGGIPVLANVGIVIWIETFEAGGISDIRRISSFHVLDSQSWFKSTDTSDKVIVANPSAGVYTGTCLLDYTKIPANTKFTVYARIYEFFNPLAKQFEDGDDFEFEDGILFEFENV